MSGAGGPKTPAELKEAGTALYKAGEFAKAGGKYAAALELLPPAPASAEDEDMRQKLRLNLAQCYIKLSSFRAAEALCDAVLAADPNCAKALFRRGQARLGRDALPEALADLLAACKLDPKSRELRTEYDELKKLTTTHPTLANRLDDLRVVEEKALRQLHTGRTDEALRTFGLIQRECDSDSVEVQLPHWEARAALGTGSGHLHAGRRAEARAAFERALDRAVSEHARAPVLAVYATIALCLLASDAPGGAHSDQAEQARAQLASALVAAEGLGDGLLSAAAHGAMACALLRADDPRAALSHARAAVQRSAAECDEHGKAIDLITLAAVERRLAAVGGPAPSAEGANAQLARALEIARALKYARVEAEALSGLARLRLSEGRASEASEFGAEAVRLARAYQLPLLEVGALASLGCASLALAERRLAPPEGVDVPAAADLFARAAALALGGQSGDGTDGGRSGGEGADERLALLLRANAHGAALQHAAAAPPGAPRDALVCGVRKDLVADIAEARELDCLEVCRAPSPSRLRPWAWRRRAHARLCSPRLRALSLLRGRRAARAGTGRLRPGLGKRAYALPAACACCVRSPAHPASATHPSAPPCLAVASGGAHVPRPPRGRLAAQRRHAAGD